ncbi:stalk domain-containing protein [Paenibacillus sp. MBLB4367]|uniref:stalk domain-containing protein n=1 Tax=Paenibacillus sp. MBLB4367 TaxID=3384767 RepID=UPI00390832C4
MKSRFMKWSAAVLFAICLPFWSGTPGVLAEEAKSAPEDTAVTITIDGKRQTFDQPAVIVEGTTMVPMRGIFEALGAKIDWDNETRTVTALKTYTQIKLTIGFPVAFISGEPVALAQAPVILQDSTMVPARFIGESLGAAVTWDNATRTVAIATGPSIAKPKPRKPLDVKEIVVSPAAEPPSGQRQTWHSAKAGPLPLDAMTAREWKTFSTANYEVYYAAQEESVFAIAQHLDAIYRQVTESLDRKLSYKIPLVFLGKEDYEKAVTLAWSEGEWNVQKRTMLIKQDEASMERLLLTALHETVHAVTLSSDASKDKTYPYWFMEGAATYHELDAPFYAAMREKEIYEALAAGKLMTWDELSQSADKWSDVELGYALSQSIYAYLAERYGEPAIASVFYTHGIFGEQLRLITNHTLKELEDRWADDWKRKAAANEPYPGIYYGKDWKYVGDLRQGKFEGFGRYYQAGKLVYEGAFRDGKVEGQGTLYYDSGSRYVGTLRDGKPDGQGTVYDERGNVKYNGLFKDNAFIQ